MSGNLKSGSLLATILGVVDSKSMYSRLISALDSISWKRTRTGQQTKTGQKDTKIFKYAAKFKLLIDNSNNALLLIRVY